MSILFKTRSAFQDLAAKGLQAAYRSFFRRAETHQLDTLLTLERASPDALRAFQQNRLRALYLHAWQTPYYRTAFSKMGWGADHSFSTQDIASLPVLTKALLKENLNDLLDPSMPTSDRIKSQSGGSTGVPTVFYHDRAYWQSFYAAYGLGYRWCGFRPGDRQTFLWGADADAPRFSWTSALKQAANNSVFENAFQMDREGLMRYVEHLQRWKPEYLWSYVSSAVQLAQFVREQNLPLRFKSIRTTAETLTPAQRELLESTFHCRVFNQYGCRELGIVAQECEAHQGLHVFSPNHWVEILPIQGASYGRLVVTCLINGVLPFLRYETGDLAQWASGDCPCGRTWPRLENVQGRMSDIIVSPSGKWIHGEFFTHLFYKTENVQQFQVVQDRQDHLQIRIVLSMNAPSGTFESLCRSLEETIHQQGDSAFKMSFEKLDRLEALPSGKFRFTANLVGNTHAS